MKENSEIEFSPDNFNTEISGIETEQSTSIISSVEEEGLKIYTWKEDNSIFIMINNITIQLKETEFYQLSKVIRQTIRSLLMVEGE